MEVNSILIFADFRIIPLELFGAGEEGEDDVFGASVLQQFVGGVDGGAGSPDVVEEEIGSVWADLGAFG